MRTGSCTTNLRQEVEVAVPITFSAVGQEGPAQVTCLRRELRRRGCSSVVAAEFLVEVPVRLTVCAECADADSPESTEVTCTASGVVQVELPLSIGARLGECEEETNRVLLHGAVTCSSTLVRHLQIALPLTFGATAVCREMGGCG